MPLINGEPMLKLLKDALKERLAADAADLQAMHKEITAVGTAVGMATETKSLRSTVVTGPTVSRRSQTDAISATAVSNAAF